MTPSVTRLRRWLAAVAVLMIAVVVGMYGYARWRVRNALHDIPAKIDIAVQQTAEGFSFSKSEQGRTLFTVRASKVVQFKRGGVAELRGVEITIYGKDASRYDRISGQEFEYNPSTGDVSAKGKVEIDLQGNPQGVAQADQSAPLELKNPIHVRTNGLIFNKETGNATATGEIDFTTPQASGSAVGVQYVAKTGTMTLQSAIVIDLYGPHASHLTADRAVLTKAPRQVVLSQASMVRERLTLHSNTATVFLRDDNTVDRLLADGNVEGEVQGPDQQHGRADQAELFLAGSRNLLQTAILTGNVQLNLQGAQAASATAGRATLHFAGQQVLQTVHAEQGVRLVQKKSLASSPADKTSAVQITAAKTQDLEMTAPVIDFTVKNGRVLERAETSGPPQIVIEQPSSNEKTVVTADKFIAGFADKNRLSRLHGEPNARIVSSTPTQPDRISTSQTLDVAFSPSGGIASIIQQGSLVYASETQKAWAQRGTYTPADQTIVLNGEPRVADGGLTTTAQVVRINRATGDATAEGDVKSTYSNLKAQPNGAMLASDDPIHVTSRSMTAHRTSAVAIYSGNARLWQNGNVVEAPTLEFDRDQRSLVGTGTPGHPVSTVLVQVDKKGKAVPVATTAARLTYRDLERKIILDGNVVTKTSDAVMTAQKMTVFLASKNGPTPNADNPTSPPTPAPSPQASPVSGTAKVDHIVAEGSIVITEPGRRATGDILEYTAAEEKFVLTGGPPSIFDAERGKTTGDSLTFYRHDDRVLVEGRETSPTVTRTRVAR